MAPLSFPGYSPGCADWCCQSHSAAETDQSAWALQDGKGGGEGFEVQKYGDGRVALIGEHSTCTCSKACFQYHMSCWGCSDCNDNKDLATYSTNILQADVVPTALDQQ